MSAALRRIAPALRRIDYPVMFSRASDAAGTRTITIETPLFSYQSAKGATDYRQNRQNRQKPGGMGARSDGFVGCDGRMHTQRVSSQSRDKTNGPVCEQPSCGLAACLTGPGGNWCADHLEPHQRRAAFVLTGEWQIVPAGVILPTGAEIEMDLAGGRTRARLKPNA